jgi:hypothetical protein
LFIILPPPPQRRVKICDVFIANFHNEFIPSNISNDQKRGEDETKKIIITLAFCVIGLRTQRKKYEWEGGRRAKDRPSPRLILNHKSTQTNDKLEGGEKS